MSGPLDTLTDMDLEAMYRSPMFDMEQLRLLRDAFVLDRQIASNRCDVQTIAFCTRRIDILSKIIKERQP